MLFIYYSNEKNEEKPIKWLLCKHDIKHLIFVWIFPLSASHVYNFYLLCPIEIYYLKFMLKIRVRKCQKKKKTEQVQDFFFTFKRKWNVVFFSFKKKNIRKLWEVKINYIFSCFFFTLYFNLTNMKVRLWKEWNGVHKKKNDNEKNLWILPNNRASWTGIAVWNQREI